MKRRILSFVLAGFMFFASSLAVQAQDATGTIETAKSITIQQDGTYERAIVESISAGQKKGEGTSEQIEVYKLRFIGGPLDGQVKEIQNELNSNPYNLKPGVGDKIVALVQQNDDQSLNIFIEGFDRRGAMIWLVILFAATLIGLSGWQGVKVVASIGISIFLIAYVLIPSFLRGYNPVPIAILLGGLLTLISTGFSTGWNRKSYVTAIGTMGGALVAYLVSLVFVNWSRLSGLSTENDRMFFQNNPLLNPRGLLFAGIIIASVGVVEDVAVSIASGIAEVKKHKPGATYNELFASGMVVGRDHMGALANTLVFAYVGASLSTLLLYTQFDSSWLKFINFDSIVDEIIRSLAGTIGLAFTVPITAMLAAWAIRGKDADGKGHSHAGHRH